MREAVVLAREDASGNKRLAAFYTAAADGDIVGASALRAHLAASLPDYMVPADYARLEALPLTANGKLDREALSSLERDPYPADGAPPEGQTEETLARIWADVLKLEQVGRHDSFFELGGDSLLGVQCMLEIEKAFAKRLPLGILFSAPTVAGLASYLDHGGKSSPGSISLVPLHTSASGPSIFMVHWIERDLARHLSRRRPVRGLSFGLAAAGGMDDLSFPDGIAAVAAHYVDEMRSIQPEGPYYLVGHSAGGLVAYEMAQQMNRQGDTVAFLGLLDTYLHDPARKRPRLPPGHVCRNLLKTPPKTLRWFAVKWLWESVPQCRRMMIKFLPTGLAWKLRLLDMIGPRYDPAPYLGRIHLFRAIDPTSHVFREPPPPPEVGWRGLAVDGLEVHVLPGTHVDIVTDPNAIVTAEAIETVLNALETAVDSDSRQSIDAIG